MPIYEYRCEGCGKHWEETLSMADCRVPIEQGCNSCSPKSGVVKRVFPQPRLKFTGEGFDSTNLTQDQIDMTPEYWFKDGDITNTADSNKLDKPKITKMK